MASRILHLAVSAALLPALPEGIDVPRFLTGSLLVDSAPPNQRDATHFILRQEELRTYDLDRFRAGYGACLASDGLVLGYYMHLVQDLAFRRFMYQGIAVDPTRPGYLADLHGDYRRLNRRLIARCALPLDWPFPADATPLSGIADFDLAALAAGLMEDATRDVPGEPVLLTMARAEAYLHEAEALCRRELDALREGRVLLDPFAGYTWCRDPAPKANAGR